MHNKQKSERELAEYNKKRAEYDKKKKANPQKK